MYITILLKKEKIKFEYLFYNIKVVRLVKLYKFNLPGKVFNIGITLTNLNRRFYFSVFFFQNIANSIRFSQ